MTGRQSLLTFLFLFGRAFIEAHRQMVHAFATDDFPSFSGGLSLRLGCSAAMVDYLHDFPSFLEGLSLRLAYAGW